MIGILYVFFIIFLLEIRHTGIIDLDRSRGVVSRDPVLGLGVAAKQREEDSQTTNN